MTISGKGVIQYAQYSGSCLRNASSCGQVRDAERGGTESPFVRELSLSVVLSRPGTEVLAVQILRFAEDGLWGRLSALGILMIFISTTPVIIASRIGAKLTKMDQ